MLHEFTITIGFKDVDQVIEMLNANGFYNIYYDQPIEQIPEENGYGYLELQSTPIDMKVFLEDNREVDSKKTRENLALILGRDEEEISYQFIDFQEWQQPFPVIDLNNGWYIQPTKSDEKVANGNIIHFEPPRAFGSGLHQTTQDCLRLIFREKIQGKKILDIGTGAGLLSIAAALCGAEQVVAIDIEDVSAEVLHNAQLNHVEKAITVIQGNALSPDFKIDGCFDWIFINIAANENTQLQPVITEHLATDGKTILSGMVEWNYKEAVGQYVDNGYSVIETLKSDEWVTVLLGKHGDILTEE